MYPLSRLATYESRSMMDTLELNIGQQLKRFHRDGDEGDQRLTSFQLSASIDHQRALSRWLSAGASKTPFRCETQHILLIEFGRVSASRHFWNLINLFQNLFRCYFYISCLLLLDHRLQPVKSATSISAGHEYVELPAIEKKDDELREFIDFLFTFLHLSIYLNIVVLRDHFPQLELVMTASVPTCWLCSCS